MYVIQCKGHYSDRLRRPRDRHNPIMLHRAPSDLLMGPSRAASPLPTASGRPPSHPSHTACGTSGAPPTAWKAWKAGRAERGWARGGRAAPALAHPPRPGLGGRAAPDHMTRQMRVGCPGRTRGALPPGGRGPSGRRASRRGTRHPHKSLRCAPALVGMPAASRRLREPACDPRLPAGRGAINDCDARHE